MAASMSNSLKYNVVPNLKDHVMKKITWSNLIESLFFLTSWQNHDDSHFKNHDVMTVKIALKNHNKNHCDFLQFDAILTKN